MILKKFFESPWGKTFPILLLFVVNIFFLGKNIPLSDGIRYWKTASDILNGFQNTTVIESHLLLNGPLYPFILAIFKGIGFTVKASIYLNAIFLYVAFTYFFKTAHLFLIQKKALIITYVLVLIDPFLFYWGAKLYSEPLAILLVCYNLYLISFYFKTFSNKTLIKVALIFCLLALTRVIFVYVLLVITMLGLIAFLILKNQKSKELFKLGAYGILFCIPYMIFTYSITNKIFFMTANGGHLLYWISSPYEKDLG
jgi:predicted neutral ceramidase superfamily lipid hydrolase